LKSLLLLVKYLCYHPTLDVHKLNYMVAVAGASPPGDR